MSHSTQSPSDRRTTPRFPWTVSLRYVSYEGDEELSRAISAATTVDVSLTGIQISSRQPIKVGAYVQVAVRVPERHMPMILLAKTRWCRPGEAGEGHMTGIQFLGHLPPLFVEIVDRLNREGMKSCLR